MSDTKYVLCVSDDAAFREQLAEPLKWSYPRVEVETAAGFSAAVDYIRQNDLDCLVSDYETVTRSPKLLTTVKERHPELPLLLLSRYETDAESGTAVAEVVDFLDDVGEPDFEERFASWVASAVVSGGRGLTPPPSDGPEAMVQDVKRALIDADSPLGIEGAVCDQLTLGGRYNFAWIGEYDRGESQVVPWVSSTAYDDWPISQTFPVGGETTSVVERALRTREVQVVDDVRESSLSVPWGDVAVERGCTAVVVVPLHTEDELYGVLGVYSSKPTIESDEVDAIEEVGATVSTVLHSMALRGRIDQQERVLDRYERLVETVGDGMYVLDADGHFMTVNEGLLAMSGYTREGLLGEHASIVLDEDDVEQGRRVIAEMLSADDDRESAAVEMGLIAKDGGVIPVENQIALLMREEEFNGTVGVLRDITERKKREQELERQNERLAAFAEIVSHDLRNPLSVAQGYLDMAVEADSTEQLANVRDALGRMEDIIGDVLALARHGQTVTETEPVSLEAVVREAWGNVETGDATLSVVDSITIAADRSRVLRLFENLFRNAIEHGSRPGTDDGPITVEVGLLESGRRPHPAEGIEDDDGTRSAGFYVADDGVGIPEEIREHAFESEFTTSDDGLGLGLWVVREVASAHGWTTTATESGSGGARFEFADVKPV